MLNQFAKISPVVNSNGYLLEKDENGQYTIVSQIRLKENEVGICIEDRSLLVMFESEPVKLTGGMFQNRTEAMAYVSTNINGDFNGQILTIGGEDPTNLYVIIGTQLYSLTENTTKSLLIKIPNDTTSFTIENSVMQDIFSRKYLINHIDIKIPNNGCTYYSIIESEEEGTEDVLLKEENVDIKISGTDSSSAVFRGCITSDSSGKTTRCLVNEEFKGKLNISIIRSNITGDITNTPIVKYEGNQIAVIVTYTPLIS